MSRRSPSPPKIKEGKQETPNDIFDFNLLPRDLIREIFIKMDERTPFLGTSKKIRDIIEPKGEFEHFFRLPKQIQNKILNQLGIRDMGKLLSTSKIVSSQLRMNQNEKVKEFIHIKSIEKEINKLIKQEKYEEAIYKLKDFILENYESIIVDYFAKVKINNLIKLLSRLTNGDIRISAFRSQMMDEAINQNIIRRLIQIGVDRLMIFNYVNQYILQLDLNLNQQTILQLLQIFSEKFDDPLFEENRQFLITILEKLRK